MRKLILFFQLIINSCIGLSAQSILYDEKVIPLNHIGQNDVNVCWAACAEMMLNYHSYPIPNNQCAVIHNQCLGAPYSTQCNCNDVGCNIPLDLCEIVNLYGRYNFDQRSIKIVKSPSHSFTLANCSSSNPSNGDIWSQIYDQIFNRNLLFLVVLKDGKICNSSHIVVGKGYHAYKNRSSDTRALYRYITYNDPMPLCDGDEEYKVPLFLPSEAAENICYFLMMIIPPKAELRHYYRVEVAALNNTTIVSNSKEGVESSFIQPIPKTLQTSFPDTIPKQSHQLQGEIVIPLSQNTFLDTIKKVNNYLIPVRYIETSRLVNTPDDKLSTENVLTTNNQSVYDVVYPSFDKKTGTISRIQLINGVWRVLKISSQKNTLLSQNDFNVTEINKVDNNLELIKDFNKNSAAFKLPLTIYEKISYPSLGYEFFHFNKNNQSYYVPVKDYTALKVIRNQSYSEKEILNLLKQQALKIKKS